MPLATRRAKESYKNISLEFHITNSSDEVINIKQVVNLGQFTALNLYTKRTFQSFNTFITLFSVCCLQLCSSVSVCADFSLSSHAVYFCMDRHSAVGIVPKLRAGGLDSGGDKKFSVFDSLLGPIQPPVLSLR